MRKNACTARDRAQTRLHATFTPRCVPQKWHALPRRIAYHCGDKMRASVNVALITHSLTYKRSICFCTYTKMLKTAHTQTRPISKLISWTYDEAHTTDFVELNLTLVKINRKKTSHKSSTFCITVTECEIIVSITQASNISPTTKAGRFK